MYCPCVTSVAVCPCNHPSNRSGIAAAFFSRQFSPAPAARKIATKRVWKMRLARPVRFSFDGRGNCPVYYYPVLSDLFLGNPVHAHFLVKGRAADAQQGCRLCQVAFGYGDRHPDLFRIPLFVFLAGSCLSFLPSQDSIWSFPPAATVSTEGLSVFRHISVPPHGQPVSIHGHSPASRSPAIFFCRLVKIRNLLSQLSGRLDTEKISQREYVFQAILQRGHGDCKILQPV